MIEPVFEEERCAVAGAGGAGAAAPPPESHPREPPHPALAQPCAAEPRAAGRPRRMLVVEFL